MATETIDDVIAFYRKRGIEVVERDGRHELVPTQETKMSILDTIKKDQLFHRKHQNKVVASFLTTLMSEIAFIGKNDGNRETTDDETIVVLKKFIKNANETVSALDNSDPRHEVAVAEIDIINNYLPKQLSEDELIDIIAPIVEGKTMKEMGVVMKELKENYAGLFDGKTASKIVREQLQG